MYRKKAITQVYDVLKAVYDLEKELNSAPTFADVDREDCSEHLKHARQQLHEVLDQVYAADFKSRQAA